MHQFFIIVYWTASAIVLSHFVIALGMSIPYAICLFGIVLISSMPLYLSP